MVGASASVLRAGIMGSISLLGQQLGRRQACLNSLTFTAAVMALLQPDGLEDVGFQLPFSATLGLVFFADPLESGFLRLAEKRLPQGLAQRIAGPVGEYFLFTLAAQAITLPVILYHFRRLSFTALIANTLVLPPQPVLMVLGLAARFGECFGSAPLIVLGKAGRAEATNLANWRALNPALILLPADATPGTGAALDTRAGWLELSSDGEKLWGERGQ